MLSTPVALFLFNRPEETQRVFTTIAAAKPRHLLLVADGPRNTEEAALCEQTRAVVQRVDWECKVETLFSDVNLGCGLRVSSGLDWVFERVPEAIILEDDCLPAPSFFPFCEELLEKYRDDERIMMIGGTNLLGDLPVEESYVYSRSFNIWGWATWRRAWAHYDFTLQQWPFLQASRQLENLYVHRDTRHVFSTFFDAVYRGQLDLWDVQWIYACLFNNGLSIVPRTNLISNVGIAGYHTKQQDRTHLLPLGQLSWPLQAPAMVYPDQRYDEPFFRQQCKMYWWQYLRIFIGRITPQPLKSFLKPLLKSLLKPLLKAKKE